MSDITRTAAGPAQDTADAPAGQPATPTPVGADEYDLRGEVGRGGMGVVYRAWDLALGREVAVKLLQDKYAPGSGTARRFVEEARITGQLQHPGIPAVYRVGVWADGRPFLAMKLIKGETLDALLKDGTPLDPLAVFEAIAQAVGYAHAHGVIHRDLKPSNVMVGSFGEVQVMDWGLAKVLACSRDAERGGTDADATTPAATEIRSPRDSDGTFTHAGSVLGTPAFMPPEQAAGETDKVDTRSDVFGLGGLLCVLLTGRPPIGGKDAEGVRLNAVRGKTEDAFARLDGCGADPDVVALCKRCLAFEPDDRPATANDVASVVSALRRAADDRAKQAELDRRAGEVKAAEKLKRRRAILIGTWAVTAALLVGVIASGVALRRAVKAETDARDSEHLTADALGQAKANLRTAQDVVRQAFHKTASTTLAEVPESGPLRFELADLAVKYNAQFMNTSPNNPDVLWDAADMFRTMGRLYGNSNQPDKAAKFYDLALKITRRLAAEGRSAVGENGYHLTADGRPILKSSAAGATALDNPVTVARAAHEYLLAHIRVLTECAMVLRDRGRFADARPLLDEAASPEQLGRLLAQCPEVRGFRRLGGHVELERAWIDLDEGRPADALGKSDRLVPLFRGLIDAPKPEAFLGRLESLTKATTDRRYFGWAVRGHALALAALGRAAEAEAPLGEGIDRFEKGDTIDDRYMKAVLLNCRGRLRAADPARRADALADFDRAAVTVEPLLKSHAYWAPYLREDAIGRCARGRLLAAGGPADRERAATDFRAARAAAEKSIGLTEGPPSVPDLLNRAEAEAGLGGLATERPEAARWFASSVAGYERAQAACPTHAEARRGLDAALARHPREAAPPPRAKP